MVKRILATLLAGVMLTSTVAFAQLPFSDIEGHWAEDFIVNEDNFEIYTSTEDFIKVKAALEEAGVTEFITSEITYVANNLVELDEETTEKVLALSDALDEIDDVQNVYHNLDA